MKPPYGRQILEQSQSVNQLDAKKAGERVAQVLGFVANQHKEAIIHDMYLMLTKQTNTVLDGYILALARCMEHDLAWHCISESFRLTNRPIPDKYYTRFNRQRDDDVATPVMRVE
jgi:hypothetical protein